MSYITESLELYELTVKAPYNQSTVVSGKVKNKGLETLSTVGLSFFFQDAADQSIYEQSRRVVSTDLFNSEGPLKPNYVRQFTFTFTRIPDEWAEGNIKAGITEIEFEQK